MATNNLDWLDPTIGQTKQIALNASVVRRNQRRANAEPDYIEPVEKRFMPPWDLALLERDVSAYNLVQKNTPAPDTTGALVTAGALLLFGFVLLRKG